MASTRIYAGERVELPDQRKVTGALNRAGDLGGVSPRQPGCAR